MQLLGKYSNKGYELRNLQKLLNLVPSDKPTEPPRHQKRQAQHRLRSEQIDELEAAYRVGERVEALIVRFKIDRKTLYNHLNQRNVPKRRI